MFNISIFDSLTHPTIDSKWLLPNYSLSSDIKQLIMQMDENNISKALAVGMKGIGSYNDQEYIKLINPYRERLVPIAFFDLNDRITLKEASTKLTKIKSLGYSGIKLHPRISEFNLNHAQLIPVIKKANELKISVLMCTYFYGKGINEEINYFEQLAKLLFFLNGAKVILLHGGTVRLLEAIEVVRSYENILLDLSFTLCKYKGSSLDLDIQFAFTSFEKRICVGSDFPEFSMKVLRERFNFFSKRISQPSAENIAFKNISRFIKQE